MFEHDAEPLEVGVEVLARQLDHLERLLDALHREVLRLGAQQRVVGGDERVDGQQAERRRAVDQHDVVAVLDLAQRAPQRQLAAHLAAHRQLRLGEPEVRGDDPVVDRVGGSRAAAQHVADGRARLRVDVEVVGQVALRVEVDRERREADAPEDVGERAHHRRLAGAALLGEDCDRDRHCAPRTIAPRRGRSADSAASADERLGLRRTARRARRRARGTSTNERRWRPTTSSSPSRSGCHSIRSPLTNTPLRLRSSSTRTPSGWRTTSACRRETVGSSKRTSAARLRPMRVHSRVSSCTTASSPSS